METLPQFFTEKALGIAFEYVEGMTRSYDINSKNFVYKNFSYFYKIRIELNLLIENPSIIVRGIGILIADPDDELFMRFQMQDSFIFKNLSIPILNLTQKKNNEFIKTLNSLKTQMEVEINLLIDKLNNYLNENKDLFTKVNTKMKGNYQNL